MKSTKYLVAVWIAVLIYGLFSFFNGTMGLSAYRHLEDERLRLQKNMETLKVINKELETTKDALLYDRDTLLSYAKDLGYGEEEERFIRIVGLGNTKKQRTSPGQAVLTVPPEFIPDQTLKIIALCAGLTVFLCLAIFGLLRFLQEKNE